MAAPEHVEQDQREPLGRLQQGSIGAACRTAPDTPIGTLLSRADAARYDAKRAGRNRVAAA